LRHDEKYRMVVKERVIGESTRWLHFRMHSRCETEREEIR